MSNDALRALDEVKKALRQMIYETTSLSPLEDDGSHKCRISKDALQAARQAYHQTIPTLRAALTSPADGTLAERCAAAEADLAKLQEPDGVLINMMRGTIPKVPASSLHKLYTEDELIDAAKAVFRERAAQLLKDTP